MAKLMYGHFDLLENLLALCRELETGTGGCAEFSPEERHRNLGEAIAALKDLTGQDFGRDIEKYADWYKDHHDDWMDFSKIEDEFYRI